MGLDRPQRDVRLEIGELVLEGVSPARRFLVAASFERELARLIAEQGLPGELAAARAVAPRESLAVPPARERLDGNPLLLGQALARSVYEGLA